MKFIYYNDTKRIIHIHPATFIHGCRADNSQINPLQERVFELPEGTYPWVKMWDYGDVGLSILVSPFLDNQILKVRSNINYEAMWYELMDKIKHHLSEENTDWFWFDEVNRYCLEKVLHWVEDIKNKYS